MDSERFQLHLDKQLLNFIRGIRCAIESANLREISRASSRYADWLKIFPRRRGYRLRIGVRLAAQFRAPCLTAAALPGWSAAIPGSQPWEGRRKERASLFHGHRV